MHDPIPPPPPAETPIAEPAHGVISRRWFLAGGGAVLAAGGAGVAVGFLRNDPAARRTPPPGRLVAAVAAERALIADLDATTGGSPDVRRVIVAARADHAAHLAALQALVARYSITEPGATPSTLAGTPRTVAELHHAERHAATAAAARAAALDGAPAVLLASISACEATHADLLS